MREGRCPIIIQLASESKKRARDMARILIVGGGLVLEIVLGDVGCLSEVKWLPHYDGVDVLDAAAVIYSVGVLLKDSQRRRHQRDGAVARHNFNGQISDLARRQGESSVVRGRRLFCGEDSLVGRKVKELDGTRSVCWRRFSRLLDRCRWCLYLPPCLALR